MPETAVFTYDFTTGPSAEWPEWYTALDAQFFRSGSLWRVHSAQPGEFGERHNGSGTFESWGVPPGGVPTHVQAEATIRRVSGWVYFAQFGFLFAGPDTTEFRFGCGYNSLDYALMPDTPTAYRGRKVAVPPYWKRSNAAHTNLFDGIALHIQGDNSYQIAASNLTVWVDYEGGEPSTGAWDVEVTDTYRGVTAAAGFTRAQTATTKAIVIGLNWGITGHIGSGQGSRDGWEEYVWGDVDKRSRIGLAYSFDGALYLLYEDWSSGSAVAMLSVNRAFGAGPRELWSVPVVVTPNVAAIAAVGRAQRQIWGMRVA